MVGWLAPILLLLARIAQGMSLGGEVSNASAYLAEIAPPERRGRYSAFFYISTGAAVLLASLLGALLTAVLSKEELAAYGWRIPFVIGGVLGLVGLWLRRAMPETEQFEENKAKAEALRNPLLTTLREHPKAVGQLSASRCCQRSATTPSSPRSPRSRSAPAAPTPARCSSRCPSPPRCSWPCSTRWACCRTGSGASRSCWSGRRPPRC